MWHRKARAGIERAGQEAYRHARKVVFFVIGATVFVMGVIMLITPGPGILGLLAGLAILAVEFSWARIWLHRLRERIRRIGNRPQKGAGRTGR